MEWIISMIGPLIMTAAIYLTARNRWVHKARLEVLYRDMDAFERLPSYTTMLLRYPFCWSVDRIIAKAERQDSE